MLNSPRFIDCSPGEVFYTLLDEGRYYCSERTMYRILSKHQLVRERRAHCRHPQYEKPELLATKPNQLWSWDITKLKGPRKWCHYYLYVLLDVYSRYVVGWMVADRESSSLGKELIGSACRRHRIAKGQLTIHADRGPSMTSKQVAQLISNLGLTKTHSRPYTSNDNPFSEAQFKTLKYCATFPKNFGSIEDAQVFCRHFFSWYNNEHRHSGINRLTPKMLHSGLGSMVLAHRTQVLQEAYRRVPNRFGTKLPSAGEIPKAVWINPPVKPMEGSVA